MPARGHFLAETAKKWYPFLSECHMKIVHKIAHITLIGVFIFIQLIHTQLHADVVFGLPAPGTMVLLSKPYTPTMINGIKVDNNNPLQFDFIVSVGQDKLAGEGLKLEGEKLIRYFLASLAMPDEDLWVNLSPYEKDKIVPQALGQTEMGRDMLAQDYLLKQLTASLIYPEKELGKKFWDAVYAKTQERYGSVEIPVNVFNKVWIMADKAEVYEKGQSAFVTKSHLKVMLEEDFTALKNNQRLPGDMTRRDVSPSRLPSKLGLSVKAPQGNNQSQDLLSQVIREIVLPEIEREVNEGKNFAQLRQIFNAIILATWYKNILKQSLINQVYTNQSMVNGINIDDPTIGKKIYQQYLNAYKKGVFNYIKESSPTTTTQTLSRKYFSGGVVGQLKLDVKKNLSRNDFAQLSNHSSVIFQTSVQPVDKLPNASTAVPMITASTNFGKSCVIRMRFRSLLHIIRFHLQQKMAGFLLLLVFLRKTH